MATYELTGKVETVGQTQTVGQKGFMKRDFIVDSGGKYPNPVQFTLKMDNCSKADGLQRGMDVVVKFTVDGRRWDSDKGTRYFIALTAMDVRPANGETVTASVPPPATAPMDAGSDAPEDLPF